MAFNFNWSPLTADASFYTRAQELLTTALNKSPKPPIIVDDILVNELNLGSVPPDLEILEIGDLAEDRFRGIFKMVYTGDAFLTLKTRVQVRRMESRDMFDAIPNVWTGKSAQYIFVYQTLVHFSSTTCCLLEPDNTSADHSIRDQALRLHHTSILKTKRAYPRVS